MIAVQFPKGTMDGETREQLIAVIDGWQWASKNTKLEAYLNARLDPDGPSGADPQPERTAVDRAIEALGGGKIIKEDQGPPPPAKSVQ